MQEQVFEYDKKLTYLQNFRNWLWLNNEERELYKEPLLPAEEAEEIFSKLYGDYK